MSPNPIQHYRRVGTCGDVETATPHKLIELLYTGLKTSLGDARESMQSGDMAAKGRALGKALDILQTLQISLDPVAGGSIAGHLEHLYDYMGRRLTEANLHNDVGALEELLNLTQSLREAWESIPAEARRDPMAA